MTELTVRIANEFRTRFAGDPFLFVSPGRINLIGEHVDYNEGYVLPAAIDRHLTLAIAPSDRDRSTVYSVDFDEEVSFSMTDLLPGKHWVNYVMGVIAGFQQRGISVPAFDCVLGGTIPSGAGLSSSAALCCGFCLALNETTNAGLARLDLARIAQHAEHKFAGVMCGLMDQYAVLFGEANALVLLDCRTMTHRKVHMPAEAGSIILVDTRVKHTLATSGYNDRRAACEEGVAILHDQLPSAESLRDITVEQLEAHETKLPPDVFIKCRYVVREIGRTTAAAAAIEAKDWAKLGSLMFESHEGLRSEYMVSCRELDFLVALSRANPDLVRGSRLMGGGFGGCTINLVSPGKEAAFSELISMEYFTSFSTLPVFYPVALAQGAHRIMQ